MTQRIVINKRYGGLGLSRKAFLRLRELGHPLALEETDIGEVWADAPSVREEWLDSFCYDIPRDDPLLLQVIDELGVEVSSAPMAQLKIVEIPDGVKWHIEKYHGLESIDEDHRSWD